MRSFDQSFLSSSPTLVLKPQVPPQPYLNMGSDGPAIFPTSANGVNSSSPSFSVSNVAPSPSARPSAAGRKRSRDEAAPNLGDDEYFPVTDQGNNAAASPENEEEWEYGEGMTLIKPNGGGYHISASSQTGTWAEVKADEKVLAAASAPPPSPERPILRSAKSQRLDLTATPAIPEEGSSSNGSRLASLAALPNGTNGHTEPTVDDFTRHLGVGWSSISADEDIQAAARGWTKFIENHYPITHAKIRLQSRGLSSYLVEANEGYFLFGEDLRQGMLVSTSLEKTWINLRGAVPIFDGDGVMEAGETPKVNGGPEPMHMSKAVNGTDRASVNGAQNLTGHGLEVEMDMS